MTEGLIHAADVARLVRTFSDPDDQAAAKSQELTLQVLEFTTAPFSRAQFIPGHITATGLVIHPSLNAVLLIHHRRLERWLLPGGHVELDDESVHDAASREVLEETGAAVAPPEVPMLAGIDVHGIPPNSREPLHYHHDLVFAFRALSADLIQNEEVRACRWFEIADLSRTLPELQSSIRLSIYRAFRALPLQR